MITIQTYSGGEIARGSIDDIVPDKTVWVDLLDPNAEELEIVSLKTGIPLEEMRIALDDEERPRAMDMGGKALIIFKAPFFEKNGDIRTTSISIFVNKTQLISLRKNRIKGLQRLAEMTPATLKTFFSKGTVKLLHRMLDEISRTYFTIMDQIEEDIDDLEEKIFKDVEQVNVSKLFEIKKTLIYFHKALSANRDVMLSIERDLSALFDKQELKRFRNIYNDIIQLVDAEATYRDIITGTHNFYLSNVSTNLNLQMKKMTVYATFILVPTLITGVYGMNFAHMPEIRWYFGYPFSIGLMILSVLLLYWYFRKKGWL